MLKISLIILLNLTIFLSCEEIPQITPITDANFNTLVLQSEDPWLLFFFINNCV